jgi:hypothetical protein
LLFEPGGEGVDDALLVSSHRGSRLVAVRGHESRGRSGAAVASERRFSPLSRGRRRVSPLRTCNCWLVLARKLRFDFKAADVLITMQDGRQVRKQLPVALPDKIEFEFAEFDLATDQVEFVHENGTPVIAEIEPPDRSSPLRPDRPVIYLDQCHWITLARQLWAPEKVLEREREAAIELIEMARDKKVILPISSANLTEMTPADGAYRRNLGLTMLQLSRGWQMRNPVHVRGDELRALFAGAEPIAEHVFTLAPRVLFIGEAPLAPAPARNPLDDYILRLSEVFAIYQVAVEDEKIPNPEGREKAEAWAQEQCRFALLLREDKVGASDAEHYAAARLVHDLSEEVVAAARGAGLSDAEIQSWVAERLDEDVSRMPFLGAFNRTVHDRVRNAEAKWEANHFNDLQFLCCAAAYADVVVGEKETSEHLRRAQKGRRGAAACRTLPEALACLGELAAAA